MFNFDLPPELQLLQRTAEDFGRQRLWPALRISERARAVTPALHTEYAAIGFHTLELPEALEGAAQGALARVLVNEALGAADAGAALALDRLSMAPCALNELGGEAALAEYAAPLLQDAGARAVLVTAAEAGLRCDGERVSGRIAWWPTDRVDLLVVLHDDGAWLVRHGVELESVRGSGLRAAGASAITLRDARLAGQLRGSAQARRALARSRLYVASLLLGVLRQATEYGRAYAQEREAFGKKIGHHQALAFLIVELCMAVEGVRLLVQEAAALADAGRDFTAAAASAFVEAVEASRVIGPAGVQLLGGHGFMQDHPAEKLMRESRALGLLLGGIDAARKDAGDALCEQTAPVQLSAREPA